MLDLQKLGYTKPLYILPFDHRNTFAKKLFGKTSISELDSQEREAPATHGQDANATFEVASQAAQCLEEGCGVRIAVGLGLHEVYQGLLVGLCCD